MARAALLAIPLLLLCLALAGGTDAARKTVGVYKLQNKKGDFSVKVTNWGATLMSVIVPDSKGMVPLRPEKPSMCVTFCDIYSARNVNKLAYFLAAGNLADVVLGYDKLAQYVVGSQMPLF